MFEQSTLSGGPLSTRLLSTCAGITGQAALVAAALLVPLIWPSALPQLQSYITVVAPGPPPPPPPPGNLTVRPRTVQSQVRPCTMCMPPTVPRQIAMIVDDPPEIGQPAGVEGGVRGGVEGGVVGSVITDVLRSVHLAPAPAPTPAVVAPPREAAPAPIARHRIGGLVKLASPIRRIEPVYPMLAKTARIEGVVELEGIIGIDGRIHELKVLKGHPFLVESALAAVRQWVYSPGTLNGDPVEVIAPITVTFRLGR